MSGTIADAAADARSDRVVAFLVDFGLLSTAVFALWIVSLVGNFVLSLGVVGSMEAGGPGPSQGSIVATSLIGIVINFVLWLVIAGLLVWYFAYYAGPDGRTIGKGMQDLRLVSEDGERPSKRQIQKRTALLLAPLPLMVLLGGLLGGIGFVLGLVLMFGWLTVEAVVMFVSEDGQRLGDSVANTYVVADDDAA